MIQIEVYLMNVQHISCEKWIKMNIKWTRMTILQLVCHEFEQPYFVCHSFTSFRHLSINNCIKNCQKMFVNAPKFGGLSGQRSEWIRTHQEHCLVFLVIQAKYIGVMKANKAQYFLAFTVKEGIGVLQTKQKGIAQLSS